MHSLSLDDWTSLLLRLSAARDLPLTADAGPDSLLTSHVDEVPTPVDDD